MKAALLLAWGSFRSSEIQAPFLLFQGFRYHFTKEHNMWDYIFLLIHLDETRFTDLTTLELHVYNLVCNV